MKLSMRNLGILVGVFVFISFMPAAAQIDNSCKYQYSFGHTYDDSYFSFCLTKYGTLAALESPKGVNHLDTVNPVDGWEIDDNSDLFAGSERLWPGCGIADGPVDLVGGTTVSEPNGPGKLPIIFNYPYRPDTALIVSERVTAVPNQKTVVLTMKTPRVYSRESGSGGGKVFRRTNLLIDGSGVSNFDTSGYAGFGYNYDGHGILLTGASTVNVVGGYQTLNGWPDLTGWTSGCDLVPFNGKGALFSFVVYSGKGPGTYVFSFKIF